MSKNTTTATTIKMSREQKSMSYRAYLTVKDALISVANYQSDSTEKVNDACAALKELVLSLHGVDEKATTLWSNLLIRLVSYKTRKADGAKWVKFNGIATFNKWVKEYKPESALDVEFKAGNDPSAKKPAKQSMPTNKEVAFNILKNLPEEERMKLVEALLAA